MKTVTKLRSGRLLCKQNTISEVQSMCYECLVQEQQKPVGLDDRFSISAHTTAKHNGKELAHKNKFHWKTKLCDIFLQLNHKGTSFPQLCGLNARRGLPSSQAHPWTQQWCASRSVTGVAPTSSGKRGCLRMLRENSRVQFAPVH